MSTGCANNPDALLLAFASIKSQTGFTGRGGQSLRCLCRANWRANIIVYCEEMCVPRSVRKPFSLTRAFRLRRLPAAPFMFLVGQIHAGVGVHGSPSEAGPTVAASTKGRRNKGKSLG
jgi:hypothetical protein